MRLNFPNVVTFLPTIDTSVSRGIERMVICRVEGTMCQTMITSLRWPPTSVAVPYFCVPAWLPTRESEPMTSTLKGWPVTC